MSLLFETIRVEGGKFCHLEEHQLRMDRSRRTLFSSTDTILLFQHLTIPAGLGVEIFKCRVTYGKRIENVEFLPYQRREIRSLSLVECDSIEYGHKFLDRTAFEELLKKATGDEILIVKNGLITDTSFSNIAFLDGKKWLTPSSPLLAGTARARLLKSGLIAAEEIRRSDLKRFKKAALLNAMIGFDESHAIDMRNIG